jgi:hypothetical protein
VQAERERDRSGAFVALERGCALGFSACVNASRVLAGAGALQTAAADSR